MASESGQSGPTQPAPDPPWNPDDSTPATRAPDITPDTRAPDITPAIPLHYVPPRAAKRSGGPPEEGEPPRVQVEGYEVVRVLGRGGMGIVYEARQQGLARTVALKMILHGDHAGPEVLARFRTEAEALARLRHPNIVQVYAVGAKGGLPFFAMEFCAGGTLADRLTGPLPLGEAAELAATLARAIHAAHAAGIVHRDIKPSNVLLTTEGVPKLSDFGLAKKLDTESSNTRSGAVMGTPAYMSPEQAWGTTRVIGPASDIYSLGAILYEAVTGQPPFVAETAVDALMMVRSHAPPPPRSRRPELPGDLEAVILQCLEKEPQRRYQTAADLADDLDRWLRGEPVRAHRQGPLYRLGKRLGRHRAALALSGGAAVGVALCWLALIDAGHSVPAGQAGRQRIDRLEWSLFRPAPSKARLLGAASEQRTALKDHLLHTVAWRECWINSERPGQQSHDAWTQFQAGAALFATPETGDDELRRCAESLDRLFEKNDVVAPFVPGYGWANAIDGHPSAEINAWALSAFAHALRRPDLLSPAGRAKAVRNLEAVQDALERCQAIDPRTAEPVGAWNLFRDQTDRSAGSVYVTTIVFQGLLDLRDAKLGWRGSEAKRDELLSACVGWLVERFDGRGWTTPGGPVESLNDGLTLHLFGLLLRAEATGIVSLPEAMLSTIPRHLEGCAGRDMNYPAATTIDNSPFRARGGELVPRPHRTVRHLWHPWAIACAAHWLRRVERTGAPHEQSVRVRRVLRHLLIGLGDEYRKEIRSSYPFVGAETLLALSALDEPR